MIKTIADPYLAQNAGRRYPLMDDAVGIPDNVILDFRCTVYDVAVGKTPVAALTSISTVTVNSVTYKRLEVTITVDDTDLAELNFDFPMTMVESEPFTTVAQTTNAVGEMTASAAVLSATLAVGTSERFAPTTIVVDSLKVKSITARQGVVYPAGNNGSTTLTGEVMLAEGKNTEPYLDGNKLHIDIYKGAGIGEYCQAPVASQTCNNVLFTINGERPGSNGNISIVGESGVTVTPIPSEHVIEIGLTDAVADETTGQCDTSCK